MPVMTPNFYVMGWCPWSCEVLQNFGVDNYELILLYHFNFADAPRSSAMTRQFDLRLEYAFSSCATNGGKLTILIHGWSQLIDPCVQTKHNRDHQFIHESCTSRQPNKMVAIQYPCKVATKHTQVHNVILPEKSLYRASIPNHPPKCKQSRLERAERRSVRCRSHTGRRGRTSRVSPSPTAIVHSASRAIARRLVHIAGTCPIDDLASMFILAKGQVHFTMLRLEEDIKRG
jgi:hypothetical protein